MAQIRYLRTMADGGPVVAAPAETGITTAEQLHPEPGPALLDDPGPCPGILTIGPLPDRTGLIIAGEADLTVQGKLHAALAALPAAGAADICLDLSGLRFIDVACTRELIAVTSRHPAAHVVIHDPPAVLLRIAALLTRTPASASPAPAGTRLARRRVQSRGPGRAAQRATPASWRTIAETTIRPNPTD